MLHAGAVRHAQRAHGAPLLLLPLDVDVRGRPPGSALSMASSSYLFLWGFFPSREQSTRVAYQKYVVPNTLVSNSFLYACGGAQRSGG